MAAAHSDVGQQDLRLEEYFAGRTQGWGIFQDRFGKLRRQFKVDARGEWDGETLRLVEDFVYDDGETEQRTWLIKKTGEHGYRGEAGDVIGHAEGEVRQNVMGWRYDFALRVGQKTLVVRLEDSMVLQNDGVLITRCKMTKFGLKLGDVILIFQKQAMPEESALQADDSVVELRSQAQ